jgi:hypothetical protein
MIFLNCSLQTLTKNLTSFLCRKEEKFKIFLLLEERIFRYRSLLLILFSYNQTKREKILSYDSHFPTAAKNDR